MFSSDKVDPPTEQDRPQLETDKTAQPTAQAVQATNRADEKSEPIEEVKPRKAKSNDLRYSEIEARLDTLENDVKRYRAEVEVLRRAQILGFMPNDSSGDGMPSIKDVSPLSEKSQESQRSTIPDTDESRVIAKDFVPDATPNQRADTLMSAAKAEFELGNYGKAINLFWKVEGKTDNPSFKYWIALSWFKLKEYPIAKFQFEEFAKTVADSPFISLVHFYLAEIDLMSGLKQRAVEKYQKIIKDYPQTDAASMAAHSINKISSTL